MAACRGATLCALGAGLFGVALGFVLRSALDRRQGRHRRLLAFERAALALDKREVWRLRQSLLCGAQTVSYSNSEPLMIVKGMGQFLEDDAGRRFLDSRNNPGCVGWQHPDVVGAVSRQLALTNTNTRYLHPYPVLLAQALLRTLPAPLATGKVFFVNSGSEANDLAIRLAKCHTGSSSLVAVERAYHGHTDAVLAVSPYKFNGPGGRGAPAHVTVAGCPDAYRRRLPGETLPAFAARCAAEVDAACARAERGGRKVAAFFVESGMSVAGVILPPVGYLRQAFAAVRRRGGLCVADEVQVGFARLGEHFWGFQQQGAGVVPDIVTMAKPMGNGFPLAAVVCTEEVARSFAATGMEYFNTFGGNPAACAAGLAVMEVIERDGLQRKARRTGEYFVERLRALMRRPREGRLIGDVRGCGLFLGVELVRDRESKEPAAAETSAVATRMLREHAILTSCDGPHHNVLVIKPPLVFDEDNVDTFVDALAHILGTLGPVDTSADAPLTPT